MGARWPVRARAGRMRRLLCCSLRAQAPPAGLPPCPFHLPPCLRPAACRPLNRILAAQQVVLPQAWIACAAAAQHVAAARAAVRWMGFLGGAYAAAWTCLLSTLALACYVLWARLQPRVWDSPPGTPWAPWPHYLRAAYGACAYCAAASWPLRLASVAAGCLPSPVPALAAVGAASAICGTLAAGYHALAATAGARCAAGSGHRAARGLCAAGLAPVESPAANWHACPPAPQGGRRPGSRQPARCQAVSSGGRCERAGAVGAAGAGAGAAVAPSGARLCLHKQGGRP